MFPWFRRTGSAEADAPTRDRRVRRNCRRQRTDGLSGRQECFGVNAAAAAGQELAADRGAGNLPSQLMLEVGALE